MLIVRSPSSSRYPLVYVRLRPLLSLFTFCHLWFFVLSSVCTCVIFSILDFAPALPVARALCATPGQRLAPLRGVQDQYPFHTNGEAKQVMGCWPL